MLLPDEYDSIYDSLAPFMGFTHAEFTRRLAEAKTVRGTVFIEIRDHEAEVVYTAGQSEVRSRAFCGRELWRAALTSLPFPLPRTTTGRIAGLTASCTSSTRS